MWYATRSSQHWYITNYQWDHATASRTTNGITPAASRTTNGITPRHHQLPMGSCQLHHETTNGITPLHHELPVGSCRLHHEIPLGSRHCITNYQWDPARCITNYQWDHARRIRCITNYQVTSYTKNYRWDKVSYTKTELPMASDELYEELSTIKWAAPTTTDGMSEVHILIPIDLGWIYRWISLRSKVKGNFRYWPYL